MRMKMTLLDSSLASAFLVQYKRLLGDVAAKPLKSSNDYNEARNVLYKDGLNKLYIFDSSYEESFVLAVRNAVHGMFIYAKKYKQGYPLKASDNAWLCVKALTTPLEEMIPDWVVINTAVLPYGGFLVCDGLVVDRRTYIGPNMIKSMTQELKTERKKWSSNVLHLTCHARR
jgi:hypothetical protein